jgi:cytochrome c oxidase assembly protein subunit 15
MSKDNRLIVSWLISGCILIFLMVVIGGITRLTHSGLSITEWNLIMGSIPPLNESQWQTAFDQYKQFPEYKFINHQMDLGEFKSIFFWEFIHRLLGRLIGIVFLIPFLWFLWKKKISKPLMGKLLFIFFLGGLQGFLGWFMVKSGLQDNPHVSHFRLATHLITAFITFGFLYYTALELIYEKEKSPANEIPDRQKRLLRKLSLWFFILINIQVIYGAFVAGLRAGLVYNTFPLMGNEWMPDAVTALTPWWENLLSNMAGVQFIHRCLAWGLFFFGTYLFIMVYISKIEGRMKAAIHILYSILLLQLGLGICTLLFSVPIWLGVLHQSMAFVLFAASILFIYRAGKISSAAIKIGENSNISIKNS